MSTRECWEAWDRHSEAMEVAATELVVTTPAGADIAEYAPLSALLARVQQAFDVELAFVSEWSGEPVKRAAGEADALRVVYGQRVLETRGAPGRASRFDALPVFDAAGAAHGTLCFSVPLRRQGDAGLEPALRSVAGLIAKWFESATAASP